MSWQRNLFSSERSARKRAWLRVLRGCEHFVQRPLRGNAVFFLFMYLVACMVGWLSVKSDDSLTYYGALFTDLFLLCSLFVLLPRRVARWLRRVCYVLGYSLALVEVFCYYKFEMRITPMLLQLLQETDSRESGEFIQTFLLQWDTLVIALVFLAVISVNFVFEVYGNYWFRKFQEFIVRRPAYGGKERPVMKRVWGIGVLTIPLSILIGFYFSWDSFMNNKEGLEVLFSQNTTGMMERKFLQQKDELYSPLHRLLFSMRMQEFAEKELDSLRIHVRETKVDTCTFTSPKIVLIIGESYIKHHSSLYGYDKNTAPRQLQKKEAGELVAFTDVVSAWNITSFCFRNFMSMHSLDEPGSWTSKTLFPAVFKKAGYQVNFFTNQFTAESTNDDFCDHSGGFFLNDPTIEPLLFDGRNKKKYGFDNKLLQEYQAYTENLYMQDSTKRDAPELAIFHLLGQHVSYRLRYPKQERKFQMDEYDRPDLAPQELATVMYYDNATLFNDSVVNQLFDYFKEQDAVVVYMPDHGEEAFDGIHRFGRLFLEAKPSQTTAYNEFQIPFEIYGTPLYRKNHPEMWRNICQAADKPFMTDDLPHLLLYLAGIQSPDFDETRSLVSPHYRENRRRLLQGRYDYDDLMAGYDPEKELQRMKDMWVKGQFKDTFSK